MFLRALVHAKVCRRAIKSYHPRMIARSPVALVVALAPVPLRGPAASVGATGFAVTERAAELGCIARAADESTAASTVVFEAHDLWLHALGIAGAVSKVGGVALLIASRKRSLTRVSLRPDIGLTSAANTLKGNF